MGRGTLFFGASNIEAILTLGNLGRAGYGATLDGLVRGVAI